MCAPSAAEHDRAEAEALFSFAELERSYRECRRRKRGTANALRFEELYGGSAMRTGRLRSRPPCGAKESPRGAPIMMYHGVKSVEARADHTLLIRFDNDEYRVFDVKPLLAISRFRVLASPQEFRKVRVAFDTVEWENGLDLDPEYLYERSRPREGGESVA